MKDRTKIPKKEERERETEIEREREREREKERESQVDRTMKLQSRDDLM